MHPLPFVYRYYRGANGVLFVYNIASRESYEDSKRRLQKVWVHTYPNIVIMLVGNMCDLKHHREVSTEEAKEYAEKNSMMFIETSAKDGTNVEAAFHNLVTGKHCTHQSPLHNTVAAVRLTVPLHHMH